MSIRCCALPPSPDAFRLLILSTPWGSPPHTPRSGTGSFVDVISIFDFHVPSERPYHIARCRPPRCLSISRSAETRAFFIPKKGCSKMVIFSLRSNTFCILFLLVAVCCRFRSSFTPYSGDFRMNSTKPSGFSVTRWYLAGDEKTELAFGFCLLLFWSFFRFILIPVLTLWI